jgi:drug/metabolite transporter (DMT)-like permease
VFVLKSLSRESTGMAMGLIGVVIFGVTLPMTRLAVVSLDPWFVTTGRAVLAGLIAGCVLILLRRPFPRASEALLFFWGGLFTLFGFPGFTGFAMKLVPASHGGVVLGILPLVVALFGALTSHEKPSLGFWVSAVIGAALVVGFSLRDGGGTFNLGDILLVGSIVSAAAGYTAFAKLTQTRPGWEVISWAVALALPITIPLAILTAPASLDAVPPAHWGAFLYLGVMSQYVGFFFWNAGLAMGGQARVSQTQLFQTFVTLVVASAMNGETVDWVVWAFALAVVLVVLVGRRARISKAESPASS